MVAVAAWDDFGMDWASDHTGEPYNKFYGEAISRAFNEQYSTSSSSYNWPLDVTGYPMTSYQDSRGLANMAENFLTRVDKWIDPDWTMPVDGGTDDSILIFTPARILEKLDDLGNDNRFLVIGYPVAPYPAAGYHTSMDIRIPIAYGGLTPTAGFMSPSQYKMVIPYTLTITGSDATSYYATVSFESTYLNSKSSSSKIYLCGGSYLWGMPPRWADMKFFYDVLNLCTRYNSYFSSSAITNNRKKYQYDEDWSTCVSDFDSGSYSSDSQNYIGHYAEDGYSILRRGMAQNSNAGASLGAFPPEATVLNAELYLWSVLELWEPGATFENNDSSHGIGDVFMLVDGINPTGKSGSSAVFTLPQTLMYDSNSCSQPSSGELRGYKIPLRYYGIIDYSNAYQFQA